MPAPITVITQDINAGQQGYGAVLDEIDAGPQSHKAVVRSISLAGDGGSGGGGSLRPTTGMIYPRGQG